ncbi:MAG: hypothetical protein HYV41_01860 [Candidatus Magasanikbacteria bacterium]|nr:hypothetical protein [Candidatus Magasanikbacteria bacterium]
MDIVSHGLWGGIVAGKKNRRTYWTAFLIGILPDFFSFGIFFLATIFRITPDIAWHAGPDNLEIVPEYVTHLYNITHSLVVFVVVFLLVFMIRRKPFVPLLAWGLHIIMDIPTHSSAFFPTPFLWPVSNFRIDGVSWVHPYIFFPNLILLVSVYLFYFGYWRIRRSRR